MATATAIASGNWSAASGVWSGGSGTGGVPNTSNAIVINSPYSITLDTNTVTVQNISGTGTLILPTTAGSFTLNCNGIVSIANIVGGSVGTPIPPTTDVQVQFTGVNGYFSTSGLRIYGTMPPIGAGVSITSSAISANNPYNTTVITSAAHNLLVGMQVLFSGHATNTGLNTYWTVLKINSSTSFDVGLLTVTGGTGGTVQHCKLTGYLTSACNGSTTVLVAGDFTGWNALLAGLPANRVKVWINRYDTQINGTVANCEVLLSQGTPISYNAGTNISTITLASTLPENKEIGSSITFEFRNVLFQSNTSVNICNTLTNAVTQACEFRSVGGAALNTGSGHTANGASFVGNNVALNSGTGHTANGASFTGNTYGLIYGTGCTANGSSFAGNSYALDSGTGHTANGAIFFGNTIGLNNGIGYTANGASFVGNYEPINCSSGVTANGSSFTGNTYGTNNSNCTVIGANFTGNSYGGVNGGSGQYYNCIFGSNSSGDIVGCKDILLVGCTLNSSTQNSFTSIKPLQTMRWRTIAYNIGGVSNAIKSWTLGGNTVYPSGTYPTGAQPGAIYSSMDTHHMILTDTGYPSWYDSKPVVIAPNRKFIATVWLQKDTNGMATTPQVQIVDLFNDPLVITTALPLASQTMTENTGTWQLWQLAYFNTTAASINAVIRVTAKNGSGNVYFNYLERIYGNGGQA